MSTFSTTEVSHTQSFNIVDSITNANIATREILDNIMVENINQFEGLMFRNSFIASNDYEGGMNSTFSASSVSQNNPAGSFRSLLTPKGDITDMKPISSYGDIKFEQFALDAITLNIDTYVRTPNKLISPVDAGESGKEGWLVSSIESALSIQAISAMVRQQNYKVYETLIKGALLQTDNLRGTQGRVRVTSDTPAQFTSDFIDDIAAMGATPEDRYVTGFYENELVAPISFEGHAKLLKEKLVIYDGQKMGEGGAFYTGMPYTHMFAGIALLRTRFINSDNRVGLGLPKVDYIILPIGRFSPFLYHIARTSGRAEVAGFTDGQLAVYATMLSGMKVEEKLDQHITLGLAHGETKTPKFTNTMKNLEAYKSNTGEITIKGNILKSSDETKVGAAGLVVKDLSGKIVHSEATFVGADAATAASVTVGSLTSGQLYHVIISAGSTGTPETVEGKAYIQHLYVRA